MPMAALRSGNLALKFGLELAAIAALAYWGASLNGSIAPVVMMVLAPGAMIVAWGRFAAPKATRRLPRSTRIPFELIVLLIAAAALLAAGQEILAAVMAALVVMNAVFLTVFKQWDA